jgi:hypothetical protein
MRRHVGRENCLLICLRAFVWPCAEIYLDKLRDLFALYEAVKTKSKEEMPELKVMKDPRGIVYIKGAIEKDFTDPKSMLDYTALAEVRHARTAACCLVADECPCPRVSADGAQDFGHPDERD